MSESSTIYWLGNEDQQHNERIKACKARRRRWGEDDCPEKDGACEECTMDMAAALQVPKEQWLNAGSPD